MSEHSVVCPASLECPRQVVPTFDLKVTDAGRIVMARVHGPLDVEHTPTFLSRLGAFSTDPRRLVIDLREVEYLDSAGVRALLRLRGSIESARGELRLVVQPGSRVERTLKLLQLLDSFDTYQTASDAWEHRRKAA